MSAKRGFQHPADVQAAWYDSDTYIAKGVGQELLWHRNAG